MRRRTGLFAFSLVAATSAASGSVACGSHGAKAGSGGEATAGTGGSLPVDAGFDVASAPHATVRIADFARPLLLYLDVCFSTDPVGPSAKWVGPMLRGTYASLENSAISSYFAVEGGTQSMRLVLEDSPDCSQTLAGIPDLAIAAPLEVGSRATLLLGGTGFDGGGRPLEVFRFDDATDPAMGPNSVRFINAAQTESALDVYIYAARISMPPCTLLYDGIPYGAAGVAASLPGDGGPTAKSGYAPLEGQNLYDLTFTSLAYASHGAGCAAAFGGLYSTDMFLGQGAWTVFVEDEGSKTVMCRDDGSATPLCVMH